MSRNSSGTYTLPAGNPVVTATTISTTWANTTLGDLATEITDSLDRSGKGGMLAVLRGVDGTVAAPAVSFTSEPGSGLYRAGAGDVRLAVGGVDALKLVSGSLGDTVALAAAANVSTLKTVGTDSALLIQGNRASASTSPEVAVGSTAARTAGDIFAVQNQIGVTNILFVNFQGLLRLANQAAAIQPASIWTAITPNTGWTAGAGLAYWKDASGIVHLKGTGQFATGAAAGMFTLPVGFRPAVARAFPGLDISITATTPVTVNVDSTGLVSIFGPTLVNTHTYSMDGVSFLGEA